MLATANFDTDRACELLAQFIDAAAKLEGCLIMYQKEIGAKRAVKVDIEYAVGDKSGTIKVVNADDSSHVICKRPTQRTKQQKVRMFQ